MLEIVFAALLTRKRFYRSMPFFFSCVWLGIASDLATWIIQHHYPAYFFQAFIVQLCIDSVLQYGILVELCWCVLRPVRPLLPRGTVAGISLLVLGLGAMVWFLCNGQSFLGFPPHWHFLACVQQSGAILRISFFFTIVAGSQFLALGWGNRELQVATGLGCYSLVSLAATVVHSHQKLNMQYHQVDVIVAASYVGALVYWIASFLRAEAPRREFTLHMRSVLAAVSETARSQRALQRIALEDHPTETVIQRTEYRGRSGMVGDGSRRRPGSV